MIETEVDVYEANGLAVKQIALHKKGTKVYQHVHEYDHLSMLAVGAIEVWVDGKHVKSAIAPEGIEIKAHTAHEFVSLTDTTVIYCIHNIEKGLGYTLNPKAREIV